MPKSNEEVVFPVGLGIQDDQVLSELIVGEVQ